MPQSAVANQPFIKAPIPHNEAARLASLQRYGILDTEEEEVFDRLTRLAAKMIGVPIALISLVDAERQWFKSRLGVNTREMHRDIAFCSHAILGDEIFCVTDTTQDHRFSANPLVIGDPHIGFYAGAPLIANDGHKLGTLCVIDIKPHAALTSEQYQLLNELAAITISLMEAKIEQRQRQIAEAALLKKTGEIQESNLLFQETLDTISQGLSVFDANFRLVFANDALLRLQNLPAKFACPGCLFDDYVRYQVQQGEWGPDADADKEIERLKLMSLQPEGSILKAKRLNGKILEVRTHRLSGGGFVTTHTDITDIKRNEWQLKRQEARLRDAIENMSEGFSLWGEDERLITYNARYRALIDASIELVPGETYFEEFARDYYLHHPNYDKSRLDQDIAIRLEKFRNPGEAEILRAYDGSWLHVTKRRTSENGVVVLVADISDLKRVEQMKDEFISTVSHELRTPLTSIAGSLGIVNSGATGLLPDKAAHLISIAASNCDRLTRLINDVLDIERMQLGKFTLSLQNVSLNDLAHQSLEMLRPYAEKYNVSYDLIDESDGALVLADPDRISQVFANLLSNAAKFSRPDSVVTIRIVREDSFVRTLIIDHGVGISDKFCERIFEKFAQADSSDARKTGTGLGLNIARTIIEIHNGTIGFESALGKGSCFYFTLPALQ